MALSGGNRLIGPVTVTYTAGATVKEALLGSGYSFEGLAEDDWIRSIQGVTDSYVRYYDNEGYDLTVSADSITAIWFTGNYEQAYCDSLLSLEKDLAAYLEAGDGRQKFTPLAQAAEAALTGFWSADAEAAASLDAALLAETDNYLSIINSGTAPVSLNITQAGAAIEPYLSTFTDSYGNVSSFSTGQAVALVPGSYSYDLTDGGINHVTGTITVSSETENVLIAELPSGSWISSVDLGLKSDWTEAVEKSGTLGTDTVYYVPDYAGTSLYPYVENASGVDINSIHLYFGTGDEMGTARKSWNSHTSSVTKAVEKDTLNASTVVIQAVKELADGSQQMQKYSLNIVRVATLDGITASAEGTALPVEFDPDITEYSLSTVSDSVDVSAVLHCAGAVLTINGETVDSSSAKNISLKNSGITEVTVSTSFADGRGRDYSLHIEKKTAAEVEISHAAGMETSLKNGAGAEILPAATTGTKDIYHLTPGETYTWIGTKNQYFHTSGTFTAANGGKITAATPITTDWISGLTAKSTTASSAVIYEFDPAFSPSVHEMDVQVGSTKTFFYLNAGLSISDGILAASYVNYQGTAVEKEIATGKFVNIASIVNQSGVGNSLLLTVKKAEDAKGVTYYQEYSLAICRSMELSALSAATAEGNDVVLTQDNETEKTSFDKAVFSYKAGVKRSASEIVISAKLYTALTGKDKDAVITVASEGGSGEITFGEDNQPDTLQTVSVPLNQNRDLEDVTITVSHPDERAVAGVYTIHVQKLEPVAATFTTTPADAVVFLTDDLSGERIFQEEDGSFSLSETLSSSYVLTAKGYVSASGSFVADQENKDKTFVLEAAPETSFTDISAEDDWSSFRNSEENNGVTSAATPICSDDAVLVWANKIGEGYGSGATGCPILVGGYLYTYAGTAIVKVDKETGEIVQSGTMAGSSSFAINAPTYADGMIFVGLSNGRVQAFNAETLESIWLYTDPLGGQANSSITYKNGYVYTGFWNGEVKTANYVCLSVTDEDPTQTTEAKQATWRYTDTGFYWAGSYTTDHYVLVTTDDGESGSTTGYGSVVSLDPSTGRVLDSLKMPVVGDLRSCICYDAVTDACYFTSKGGYFCRIRVNADGSFVENSLQTIKLSNGGEGVAMSTSTPTIYNGRAYIGVSGTGQFTAYSGHNITVIDLATWSIAYSVPTQGSPQTSGILTTAYEGDSQVVYVYFLDNYTPGKIRVIKDQPGQTAMDPEYITHETYTVKNQTYEIDTAYVLFTPSGSQAQYAICSPIVDADGNMYFKNDSAQLMKLSSTITYLEITAAPETVDYCEDQTFDPTGIQVLAHYANGITKDITATLSFYQDPDWELDAETQPLTAANTEIYVKYDQDKLLNGDTSNWTMYHNEDGEAGYEISVPHEVLTVNVSAEHVDENDDKICDRCGKKTVDPPVITEQPENITAGTNAAVSYHITAENEASYQWQYSKTGGKKWLNSSAAAGGQTDTLSFKVSSSNAANIYRCVVVGKDGSQLISDIVGVELIPAVVITQQPKAAAAAIGEVAEFTVVAENAASYQWQYSKDGAHWYNSGAEGNQTDTLHVTGNQKSQGNRYRCVVLGIDGNKKKSLGTAMIVLQTAPKTCTAKVGETAGFSLKAEGIDTYLWQYSKDGGQTWYKSGAAGYDTDSISFKVTSGNRTMIYRCKLTTADGASAFTKPVGFGD